VESPPPNPDTRPSDASLPTRIGGYRIVRRLATGGTSDVLLARAEGPHGFERPVVLKLLLQQFREDEKFERMFAREAAAYARLSHPAIVKLYDFFSDASQLVMVLEFIDGLPLHKLRALLKPKGRSLDDRAAMFIGWRVFSALTAAHSARDPQTGEYSPVIHRDVNPSNVLIPWDGHVKIADFGIAKVAGIDGETQAGLIKGTYGYMAPEQVRGEPLTVRADVYAASLLLWELLAGRKAIVRGSGTDIDVLRAMAEPRFPSLTTLRPDLPKTVLEAISRGLEADPDRRAVYADELCSALRTAVSLDEGRQALIDVLSYVRPPASHDDLAVTTSRPAAVRASGKTPSDSQETLRFRSDPPPEASPDDTLADAPRIPKAPARPAFGTTMPMTGPARPAGSVVPQQPAAPVTLKLNSGAPSSGAARPGAPSRVVAPPQAAVAPNKPLAPPSPPAAEAAAPSGPSSPTSAAPTAKSGPTSPRSVSPFPKAGAPLPPAPPASPLAHVKTLALAPQGKSTTPSLSWQPSPAISPAAMTPGQFRPHRVVVPAPGQTAQPQQGGGPASPLAATVAAQQPGPVPSSPPTLASSSNQRAAAPVSPQGSPPAPWGLPPSARPLSPHAAWTPSHPSYGAVPGVVPTENGLWRGQRGWLVAIAISLVVSVFSLAIIVLWSRKDTSASTPPKPSATARTSAPEPVASAPAAQATAAVFPAAPAAQAAPLPTATVEAPAPAETAAPVATAAATPAPGAASNMGTVRVVSHGSHRVWVDDRLVGESPGSFPIRCGQHSVRVGSAGTAKQVSVPCGGEVDVR
jgi:serine/threonine-protein kinase